MEWWNDREMGKDFFIAPLLHHSMDPLPACSRIHVSLLPPPCEEFTTREPCRSATRVSPPGTIVTFSPYRMKGRKSMCRPCIDSSQKEGARDDGTTGWSM